MTSRRWPHRGRRLKGIDPRPFVDADDELRALDHILSDRGFDLTPSVRPYLTVRNVMTFVFVWRRRGGLGACTSTVTWRVPPEVWREALGI